MDPSGHTERARRDFEGRSLHDLHLLCNLPRLPEKAVRQTLRHLQQHIPPATSGGEVASGWYRIGPFTAEVEHHLRRAILRRDCRIAESRRAL